MSGNVSTNMHASIASGCGGTSPALPRPRVPTTDPDGFPIRNFLAATPVASERFAHSQAGGVMIGRDGAPAGRVPAGAFIDLKDGSVYGADGKPITLPEGATVDFFDLPDIAAMRAGYGGTTTAGGGSSAPDKASDGSTPATKEPSKVDGQWGPGGVTPIKGGGVQQDDCGMDHGPATKAGGSTSTGTTVAAGGSTGTAATDTSKTTTDLLAAIESLRKQVTTMATGGTAAATTAGGATAVAGANSLGSSTGFNAALADLVAAIRELGTAIKESPVLGGGPGQKPPGKDLPPFIHPPAPSTQVPPKVEPPKTETSDSSSSGTGSSDTTAPTSGSSTS